MTKEEIAEKYAKQYVKIAPDYKGSTESLVYSIILSALNSNIDEEKLDRLARNFYEHYESDE